MIRDDKVQVEEIPLSFGSIKAYKIITLFSFYETIYDLEKWSMNVLIKRFNYNYKNSKFNNKKKN